jgi:2,3-bisphosphoglycerate-independent phosphoglycerate mutase
MDPITGVQASYDAGVTDEFIKPIVCVDEKNQPLTTIQEGDAVIFFNFRNDRARELTHVLTQADMPEFDMKTIPLYYCCLTPYDDKFTGVHILFDKEKVQHTLGEVVAAAGFKQLRIAETEKYAHVTFFFSGGREAPFAGEERILINSPKVATYDLQPQMSVYEVKDALIEALHADRYNLVILNFANGDMVGHTGVYDAICAAVKAVDSCVDEVVPVARAHGYTVLITSDHGNADYAINENGTPNTAHSLNKVPFIVVDDDVKTVRDGILADISPTILKLMNIEPPAEMTGECLI